MTPPMTESTEAPLTILALEVANVLRVRAARVHPDGSLITIGGKNRQGKTSLLKAIEIALGGKKHLPDDPIHEGARGGNIRLDVGEFVIHVELTPKGSRLTLKDRDGNTITKSPQTTLDKLYSALTFDPLEFVRSDGPKQDAMLRKAIKVDFTELDAQRKAKYEERTEVNREVSKLEGQLAGMLPHDPAAPEKEDSVAELMVELERRQAAKAEGERLEGVANDADESTADALNALEAAKQRVEELEQALKEARETVAVKDAAVETAQNMARAAWTAAGDYTFDDPEETKAKLTTLQDTNRKVQRNAERKRVEEQLDAKRAETQRITEAISAIDDHKQSVLQGADFPVQGLSFDEVGPLLNGKPLTQASESELWELSIAVAFAQNPRLRVALIRSGSGIDSAGRQRIAELAEKYGGQCWLERMVEADDGCSVFIEDGEVVSGKAAE